MTPQQEYDALLAAFADQVRQLKGLNEVAALAWIDEAQRMLNQAKDDVASRTRYGGNEF